MTSVQAVAAEPVQPAEEGAYPSRRKAYYIASVIFLATIVSFLDRQILALLVAPIRTDLGISDTQIGLLYGFAFVVLYTTLGLPIGRLIDRGDRRLILAIGIAFWSLMTILCGFASSFAELFAARVGVGIGEACLTPAACSLLADCFERRQRGRALNFYFIGVTVGVGVSMAVGGVLYSHLAAHPGLPLLGQMAPWRATFVLVGAPGLLIALAVLLIDEPARHDLAPVAGHRVTRLLPYLTAEKRTLACVFLAHGLMGFSGYALLSWGPSVFMRGFGLSIGDVGLTIGLIAIATGILGSLLGGYACDRWSERNAAAKFFVTFVGAAVALLGLALFVQAGSATVAFGAIAVVMLGLNFAVTSGQAMVQELFPNQLRGQASAVLVIMMGLFGTGCGPLAVALLDRSLLAGHPLSHALVAAMAPALLLVVLFYALGRGSYAATRTRVQQVIDAR